MVWLRLYRCRPTFARGWTWSDGEPWGWRQYRRESIWISYIFILKTIYTYLHMYIWSMEYEHVPLKHAQQIHQNTMFSIKIIFWPITYFGNKTTWRIHQPRPGFETLLGQDCRFGRWVSWHMSKQKTGALKKQRCSWRCSSWFNKVQEVTISYIPQHKDKKKKTNKLVNWTCDISMAMFEEKR